MQLPAATGASKAAGNLNLSLRPDKSARLNRKQPSDTSEFTMRTAE
jgi:hypothetical protein